MQAKFYLANIEATRKLGQRIGEIIPAQTVIALCGQLGSGKTSLVQAIAKGLQVEELVVSPTFVVINEYHSGRIPLYHLDLYRYFDRSLKGPDFTLFVAQLEEILQTKSVVVIEWAEMLFDRFDRDMGSLCPNGYLRLDLAVDPNNDQARSAILTALGKKDQGVSLLFSDLCQLTELFLSN